MNPAEFNHPSHLHHLECPRCGHHSIVMQSETIYSCLRCGWRRDLTDAVGPAGSFLAVLLSILGLLILL